MAQRTKVFLIDDLDGGDAAETLTFALDGKSYEIDLNAENAERLRNFLAPYVAAGRRSTAARTGRAKPARNGSAAVNGDTAKIRAWAKEKGYEVNDRGRVPANIREAYESAGV